ncbi:hypothetical protein Cgig2_010630 [Carnegiea gigantea]|uniref:Reverse transcriptase n=1 Tax=Carnegiea gigantea TaxID=171969 RepID=A0A9Q1GKS9_9CARY|nr:hypothetical protein Cgig2_010630 [Carnegiea gigantea]
MKNIANTMEDAWCILGDFNSVLHLGDRIGGTDIQDAEVRQFEDCIRACDIQEMQSRRPYFSWTNKIVWTRIYRVFYDLYGFSQAIYMANSLSDHTALIIDTPGCPKLKSTFQFYDMWIRDSCFYPLVTAKLQGISHLGPYQKLKKFLRLTQVALQHLNRTQNQNLLLADPTNSKFQQNDRFLRDNYTRILSSVIDILRQQCKAEWISYGDDCTRYFFAKAKQRKTASYIYELQDEQGNVNQGFPAVATILQNYYKGLLGEQDIQRCNIDPQVMSMGNTLTIDQQFTLCAPFSESEIKAAMFSTPNTKSPGPDGYSSGFFKSTWHLTGGLAYTRYGEQGMRRYLHNTSY